MMDAQMARLRAMGELETVRTDIQGLAETLDGLSLWRPAVGMRKACDESLLMLDRLVERFDRKLVVTLVGPSGSGKSTLLNALAGEDNLSPSGHRRPTTQHVVAFCRQSADAGQLMDQLGPENIRIRASQAAEALENVILIDTPDTDSTHQDRHVPIIHKAISLSDVLVCVFDGENPKRRDHTDFLAPYVRLFSGESLVVAVNKCDRLAESELTGTIMPDFSRYIRDAWSAEPAAVLCVSARSHLKDPGWDREATPKHDRNQFDQLRQLIVGTFNRSGFSVDRRLENARQPEGVPSANRSQRSAKGEKRPGRGHRPDGRVGGRSHAAGGDRFSRRWQRADAGHQRPPVSAAGPALAGAGGMAGGGLDPDPGFRHRHRLPAAIRQSGPADCRGGFRGQALCGF